VERLGADGPVDLVGHDWGGGFVVRLVSLRPELVRSWVTDAAGLGHADFQWHQFAKTWQTPGAGEAFIDRARRAGPGAGRDVGAVRRPHDQAVATAGEDPTMVGCILALYRSAVEVGREWAPEFRDVPAPGLVVVPSEEPFLSAEVARHAARQAGASVAELAGLGHWWMLLQDPARGAAMLERF
jgi:pimeloyl-ACP methyl ester carboxylesterase